MSRKWYVKFKKAISQDINKMMYRYWVDLLSKNTDIGLFVEFQVAIKFVDKRSVNDFKEVSKSTKVFSNETYHFCHSCADITFRAM